MSDTKPQYGERIETQPERGSLPGTTIVNNPAKNEYDLRIEELATKRSLIRTAGTVMVFALLATPVIISLLNYTAR